MYKSLIELSDDRADFLSRLFSIRRPPGLSSRAPIDTLIQAYSRLLPDGDWRDTVMAGVADHLRVTHGFPLSDEDFASIEFVHGAFYEQGPGLTYSSTPGMERRPPYDLPGDIFQPGAATSGFRGMPSFARLMVESDGAGRQRGYLANEENFLTLKEMQRRNLIIPIVGDFGGPTALRTIGHWLKERDAVVSLFYTSNVEQYLFQPNDSWQEFYANVATLPLNETSTFIRSASNRAPRSRNRGIRMSQLVQPIEELLVEVRKGRVESYRDVVAASR
jgi:hypothetical protein